MQVLNERQQYRVVVVCAGMGACAHWAAFPAAAAVFMCEFAWQIVFF
jgi:hypothetical protein